MTLPLLTVIEWRCRKISFYHYYTLIKFDGDTGTDADTTSDRYNTLYELPKAMWEWAQTHSVMSGYDVSSAAFDNILRISFLAQFDANRFITRWLT